MSQKHGIKHKMWIGCRGFTRLAADCDQDDMQLHQLKQILYKVLTESMLIYACELWSDKEAIMHRKAVEDPEKDDQCE